VVEKSRPHHKMQEIQEMKTRCTARNITLQPHGQNHEDPSKSKAQSKIHDAHYVAMHPSRTLLLSENTSPPLIPDHSHAPFPSLAAVARSAQRTNGSVILHLNIFASHSTAAHHVHKAQLKVKATSSTEKISLHNISGACTPHSLSRKPLRKATANFN